MQNADRRSMRGFVGPLSDFIAGKAIRRNLGLSMSNCGQIKLTGYPSRKKCVQNHEADVMLSLSCELTKIKNLSKRRTYASTT